jgi:hypothetical protein
LDTTHEEELKILGKELMGWTLFGISPAEYTLTIKMDEDEFAIMSAAANSEGKFLRGKIKDMVDQHLRAVQMVYNIKKENKKYELIYENIDNPDKNYTDIVSSITIGQMEEVFGDFDKKSKIGDKIEKLYNSIYYKVECIGFFNRHGL